LIYSDSNNKVDILNTQFKSAYTQEDQSSLPALGQSSTPTMPDINISCKGVHKLLSELKIHIAAEPDSISLRLLREVADIIAPALTHIYQTSLDTGTVPTDWRTANIVPIFKKGDKSKSSNYRPVSLTAICSKMLEHIIHSNVMDHLTYYNILSDRFRARRSCETQLFVTIQELAKTQSEGKQIDAILLDFSKAFDKVPHNRLLLKLDHYGIRGNTLQWVRHFLTDRTQQVLLEGTHSSTCAVDSSVPRGTVRGPLPFLAFINDIPDSVTSNARLFTDDYLLYRVVNTNADQLQLQEDLHQLEKWENTWQMSFNVQKCR